ncbi:MAG: hypothetical protein KJ880_04235 [Candidatus Omnitrophica bacterium]|nr:hypothetical protein [Candidatus Omnitrophota bacterium]MBU1869912.1 hypothetical protein [Candidatus Omnitrophota bacterium]
MVASKYSSNVKIRMADMVISANKGKAGEEFFLDSKMGRFLGSGSPDLNLTVHNGALPKISLKNRLFYPGRSWSVFQDGGKTIFAFYSPGSGKRPYALAAIDPGFKSGNIHFREKTFNAGKSRIKKLYPFIHPVGQVLIVNLLSRRNGVLVHSCGIKYKGKGYVFAGVSGAGKTTISRLLRKEKDISLLNDDRIIVRKKGKDFFMYGTPWHGDIPCVSAERAPLTKVFFLKQAKRNYLSALGAVDITSRFLVRIFPLFWDKEQMDLTLKLSTELAEQVPCYELGFLPNKSIVEFLKNNRAI